MKRIGIIVTAFVMLVIQFVFSKTSVLAANIVAQNEYKNFNGDVISNIEIYDNGTVKLDYRYGLRKVDMYYCVKGEDCDNGIYDVKNIMESSEADPFKNDGATLGEYNFKIGLLENTEYRIRIEAFFGTSSAYSGTENIYGSFTVGSVQIADTKEFYVTGGSSDNEIDDVRLSEMMDKIQAIVNTAVIPIIYAVIGMLLVIKGAILGAQIVKSADDPLIRREKIGSLKWLVIGVAVAFLATTVVGAVTGFFKDAFNL